MRCPHCGVGIRFEEEEGVACTYPYSEKEKSGLGYELTHGHCPDCEKLIVVLKEGPYKKTGSFTGELQNVNKK
ncbi:MAG: hypothetical protein WBP93_22925 [Pyrinomonadaceae bacterium]